MLYINTLKYNIGNLLGLINILNKIYNKKININIIDLKHVYLDNSILADAIVRKLNDRQKRILKIMKKVLNAIKTPKKKTEDKNINSLIENEDTLEFYKYKENLFEAINNKFLKNLRLQGNGRLTKRLTASRSLLKRKNKTTLKMKQFPNLNYMKLLGHRKSNIQYLNINSYTRNGSFGFKS
jgi:Mitochondrial ribosomal protein (VAR1)